MPRPLTCMRGTPEERFWAKVQKDPSGCWLWAAYVMPNGYGKFGVSKECYAYAHRFSYQLAKGEIPEGLDLDHLCRVRHCVNPDHLEPVSRRANLLRGEGHPAKNAAKTHCPSGHPYDERNTYVWGTNRQCITCRREYDKRRRPRRS